MSGDHNKYANSDKAPDAFLRDYIAAKVLASLVLQIKDFDFRGLDWYKMATVAYRAADAMMVVREE